MAELELLAGDRCKAESRAKASETRFMFRYSETMLLDLMLPSSSVNTALFARISAKISLAMTSISQ